MPIVIVKFKRLHYSALYTLEFLSHNLMSFVRQPMSVSPEDFKKLELSINDVKENGSEIRSIFENYYDEEIDIDWEVDAAVEAFRYTFQSLDNQILATLYIIGESRV